MEAMDECIIKRYNENKEVEKEISVSIKYMPKSRVLHYLVNKQQHISLPVVSVSIGGISRDNSRVFNKIDGPIYHDGNTAYPLQPIPIDIVMRVSFLGKYQNDMDQMLSNFMPYFDPYIILSWEHPSIDREIRSEVVWDGSLTYNYPESSSATDSYRVGVDTTFTIKGWLFKKEIDVANIIHSVNRDLSGVA
jgi:hypothetical protein